ncbi:MAG: hypothetical protein K2I90_06695, partial [Odoribacter sp.]|nr:hypothetical protein [Odoribacter sp.]
VDASRLNAQRGCAVGKDRKTVELNQYLEVIHTKIYQLYRELLEAGKPITAESVPIGTKFRCKPTDQEPEIDWKALQQL